MSSNLTMPNNKEVLRLRLLRYKMSQTANELIALLAINHDTISEQVLDCCLVCNKKHLAVTEYLDDPVYLSSLNYLDKIVFNEDKASKVKELYRRTLLCLVYGNTFVLDTSCINGLEEYIEHIKIKLHFALIKVS